MIRLVLLYVLPLISPIVIFVMWVLLTSRRGNATRTVAQRLQGGSWTSLLAGGLLLAFAGMFYVALNDGSEDGPTEQTGRIEDGRTISGSSN
jgi:hypothetical protein